MANQPVQVAIGTPVIASADGDNIVIISASARQAIYVHGCLLTRADANSGATDFLFKDTLGNTLYGPFHVLSEGLGFGLGPSDLGWFNTAVGAGLVINASQAGSITGGITYWYA